MKNLNIVIAAIIFFVAGFIVGGRIGCRGGTPNETDNINMVDSLEIIQQAQAPLKGQIVENERIIAGLAKTLDELRIKERAGNELAGKLAQTISHQKEVLKKERAKLERLTILLTETQTQFSTDIVRGGGVGPSVGADPLPFTTVYDDPDDWFHLSGNFNLNTNKADYSLVVRNEFTISDFTAKNGVAKFRVESKNPFSYVLPGTNSFSVPIDKPKRRRFGLGFTAGAFTVKDFFSSTITAGYGAGIGLYYRIL